MNESGEQSDRLSQENARLRERVTALEAIIANTPDAVYLKDRDGKYVFVNEAGARMIGTTVDDMIGRDDTSVFSGDELRAILEADRHVRETGESLTMEQHVVVDGAVRTILTTKSAVRNPVGEVSGVVGISTDVTDLRGVENERDELHRERTQLLDRWAEHLEQLPLGCAICGPNLVADYWNPEAERIFGFTADEVIGRSLYDLIVPPALHAKLRPLELAVVEGQKSVSSTNENLTKDGRTIVCEWVGMRLVDPQGTYRGLLAMCRDVTARNTAERAVQESEARLAGIVQFAMDAIILLDDQERVVLFNPAAERMFGVESADVLGKPIANVLLDPLPEGNEEDTGSGLEPGVLVGVPKLHRFRGLRANGEEFPTEATVSHGVVGDRGLVTVIVRDISKRLRIEGKLAKLQTEERLEAIGRLAGGVAHDFNNMLTVITGYAEVARRQLRQDDPLFEYVNEIAKAADQATVLTRHLLAFGRKQILQPKVLAFNTFIANLAVTLSRLIGDNISLTMDLSTDVANVRVDPSQVEQVLISLAVNARDAMPGGGQLRIATRRVVVDERVAREVEGAQPGVFVELWVADTGEGMSDEVLAHIFEPFYTTKPVGEGTGLGLSSVYGIIQQCGGFVQVQSQPLSGTTFRLYFPVDVAVETAVATPPADVVTHALETILVVEDEDSVRRLTRDALKIQGYRVLEACDAGEALLVCESHPGKIDLMLTDVVMPGMNGPQLARRLAQVRPDIRVLFMSGYTADAIQSFEDFNGAQLLEKPFSPNQLLAKVREAIDQG